MAHDVFISHPAKDQFFGDAICAALEANGIRCWIASRDLPPRANRETAILEAVSASKLMVVVSTLNGAGPVRNAEIDLAVKTGLPIFPVRSDGNKEAAIRRVLDAVTDLLDGTPPTERPAAPPGLRVIASEPRAVALFRVLRGYLKRPAIIIAALGAIFVVFVAWQLAMDSLDQARQSAANNPSGVIDHPSPDGAPGKIAHPRSGGKPHVCLRDYPADSVRLGEQGTTTLGFTILSDGTTSDIQVVRSSGFPRLDAAAIRCVSSWLYRPATKDGDPVAVPWKAEVKWVLH